MYLRSLANCVPELSLTQTDMWELFNRTGLRDRLNEKSVWLVEKVLTGGDSGVDKRHVAFSDFEAVPTWDAETLNRRFEDEAPKLASRALEEGLRKGSLDADQLDALIVCTCTGYICPGVSSHVAERVGMRRDALLLDLVGSGCGAAIPSIRNAAAVTAENPEAKVAVVAVEICSAAFFMDDDPGVLISACLFGDGASASIWSGSRDGSMGLRAGNFDTWHEPERREMLRFENSGGKLRNRLHVSVPAKAAQAVRRLHERSCEKVERPIQQIISHAGGREVLRSIERAIPEADLSYSWETLRKYGNMSSPSVLFALEEFLKANSSVKNDLWLTAFGAGFSAHSFRLVPDAHLH